MPKKLIFFLFVMTTGGALAQSWLLKHTYPLELPGGVCYQQVPDSLIQIYLPKDNPTLEEVRRRKGMFHNNPDDLKLQKGTSVWAKLEVVNKEAQTTRFLFESDSYYNDWSTIDVYIIASDSVQQHIVTGNDIRPKDKAIRDLRNVFWLELKSEESRQLLLRFNANGDRQRPGLDMRILDRNSLQDFEGLSLRSFYTNQYGPKFQIPHFVVWNSREFVIDSTENFSFEQVKKQWDVHARFYRRADSYPSRIHTVWSRLKIINTDSVPKHYFFDTGGDDPYIEVYLPTFDDEYRKVVTGKSIPLNEKAVPSPLNFVSYSMASLDTAYIYIKYEPLGHNKWNMANTHIAGLIFMDSDQVLGKTRTSGLWKGIILGILIFQLLYFLLRSLLQKERLGLYYALIILGFFLLFVYRENTANTFFALQLFIESDDLVLLLSFILLSFGLYAFTNKYLRLKTYMPLIFRVQSVLLVLIIVLRIGSHIQDAILGYVNAPSQFYFPFGYYMLLAFASFLLIYFISSLVGHFRRIPYALTYFIAFSPFLLITLISVYYYATTEGGFPVLLSNLTYLGFILTSVLFAIVGAKRHNEMKGKEVQADALLKLNEAKAEFYSNITHEFRTPLTVIMGLTQLIEGHSKEKELIQKNSQEVLNLVQQLLEISKAQSGNLQLKLIDDNIILYLEYLIESFYPLAKQKNIKLSFHHDEEEVILAFDREKIKFIINNLVGNALKFTPGHGTVRVVAQAHADRLILSVADTGVGLSPPEAEKIFDRYYQVKKDTTQVGDGIGLALTKELVELLQGTISVESKEQEGSTFRVSLPLPSATNGQKDGAEDQGLANGTPLSLPTSANESIALVIEDHEDVRYYIEKILSPQYKILTAKDGEAGWTTAVDVIPDIIISDVMMPKMDGYTLTEKLKTDPRTNHIPVILLTAKAAQEEKIQGLSCGADAYLTKPFHEEELTVRMNTLIESRRKLRASFVEQPSLHQCQNRQDPFMTRVLAIMEEHYGDEDFGIRELGDAVHLSRMQVHRKLKALTDYSTSQFISYFRLEKGKKLLDEGALTIAEVAYSCGFSDPGYFSKLFGKKYGVSPKAYRSEKVG